MSPGTKVTPTDISRQSGYSPATVSMILSGRTDVSFSADTVRKVRETAEALGYAPTAKKRPSLFDRKTVLIVYPNTLNPYYSTIVQAIQQAAADKDCDILVYMTYRDVENETRILNAVAGSDLAGVVFIMMPQSTELVEYVNRLVPVVVIGNRNISLNADTVEMNNHSVGAVIIHYMIGPGHKHVAHISTTLNEANSARVRCLEGVCDTYRDECSEGSVIVRSHEVTPKKERDNISIEHAVGFELTRKCLGERRITTFVAVNDVVAYGMLDAIRAEGRRVPEDYSVCGFDNIFPLQFLPVGLTTVEHYIADKGRNAFEILHSKMSGESSDCNITCVEFKYHLIVRDSTATPREEEKTE